MNKKIQKIADKIYSKLLMFNMIIAFIIIILMIAGTNPILKLFFSMLLLMSVLFTVGPMIRCDYQQKKIVYSLKIMEIICWSFLSMLYILEITQ